MMRISNEKLRQIARELLEQRGVNTEHAEAVVDTLVTTSLRGVDTHGVRLLPLYLKMLDSGKCNSSPRLRFEQCGPTSYSLDADFALGPVAAVAAVKKTAQAAVGYGNATVSVKNANHFGAAGYYAARLADLGMIGMVFSNANALVAPYNGRTAVFGTNPIAIAARGNNDDLFLLDMATSQISYSKVVIHRQNGRPLEPGWVIDTNGAITVDPTQSTFLAPLGGYKGQGLAMAVEILCSVLTNSAFDHEISPVLSPKVENAAHAPSFLFMALDISSFTDPINFRNRLSELIEHVRQAPSTTDGAVLVPGDKELACHRERTRTGIPIDEIFWNELTHDLNYANTATS